MLGKTVGQYKILEKLGQGRMGEVYLAEDTSLEHKVALKFLAPELAQDREYLIRFRNEAKSVADLVHPNIATMYDVGEFEERPFLVFEHLDGQTLEQRVEQGPLSIEDVVAIGKALASGLAEAHSHGIVHRAIKSANVMITTHGEVKILDFGLARRGDAGSATQESASLEALNFMSPERLRDNSVDERSDIWSLGVVLYQCLTGKHPFEAEDREAIGYRIELTDPAPPTSLRARVPLPLESCILTCLEKDPDSRVQSAKELLTALDSIEISGTTQVVATTPKRGSMRPRRGFLAAAAIAVLAFAAYWGFWRMPEVVVDELPPRVAVLAFDEIASEPDSASIAGFMALLQAGLANSPDYRVVSSEYIDAVMSDAFGHGSATLDSEQELDVGRESGATHVLTGELLEEHGQRQAIWRIVVSRDGSIEDSGVTEAAEWTELAHFAVRDISDALRELALGEDAGPASTVAVGTDDPAAYQFYAAGLVAQRQGVILEARDHFLSAVELDSTFALAAYELSRTFDPNVEMEQARAAAALAWNNRDRLGQEEVLLLEAHRLLLDYQVGSAIVAYESAVALMPDSREALLGLANTQGYFRHWGPSLATALQGLRYYGEDPEFLRVAVAALFQLGNWSDALKAAQALQASDARIVDVARTVAEIHARRGEFDLAEGLYRTALERDPSDAFALKGLAFCQYGRGDLEGAVQTIMDFLKSDFATPDNTPYVLWSGSGLGLRGFLMDGGRLTPPRLGRRKPRNWLPAQGQDFLYADLPALAVKNIDADSDPLVEDGSSIANRLDAHEQMIRAWIAAGELDRAELAIAKHQAIVDSDPNLPRGFVQRLLYTTAAFEFARGNVERAYELLGELFREGFVRLGTDEIQIYQLQAAVLAELGERQRAIEVLEELLSVFASRSLAHLQLAQLYEADGQFDAARASYDRSLELWSEADREYPHPEQVRARLGGL